MTAERLSEIEACAAATTLGPWTARHPLLGGSGIYAMRRDIHDRSGHLIGQIDSAGCRQNAEFISAARTDVPDLCAALREAWQDLDEARACCRWEADTQRRHLEQLGMAKEYEWGCDSIQYVAKDLLAARKQRDEAREVLALIEKRASAARRAPRLIALVPQASAEQMDAALGAIAAMAGAALGGEAL